MLRNAAATPRKATSELERVSKERLRGRRPRPLSRRMANRRSRFRRVFFKQVYVRNLSEAIIMNVTARNEIQSLALVNPYDRPLASADPRNFWPSCARAQSLVIPAPTASARSRSCRSARIPTFMPREFDPEMTTLLAPARNRWSRLRYLVSSRVSCNSGSTRPCFS